MIQVKRFRVRTIARMVTQMSLSEKMKRRGKKKSEHHSCAIVEEAGFEKKFVFCFMQEAIRRETEDGKSDCGDGKCDSVCARPKHQKEQQCRE